MKSLVFAMSICLSAVSVELCLAQKDPEAVCLRKIMNLNIEVENGSLRIQEQNILEKVFYRNFEKNSRESIFYSDLDPLVDFDAKTLIPNQKNKFKTLKVETFETKDIVQPGVFYGGYKRKDFAFPGLEAGAVGKLQYTREIKDPHLLSPFYFNDDDILVEVADLIVTAPAEVEINYKSFGLNKNDIVFTRESHGTEVKYTWSLKNVLPFHKEKDAPGRAYNAPHVIVFIQSFPAKGKKQKVSSDVSDLYGWYFNWIGHMQTNDNNYINEIVKGIVEPGMTEREKTEAIFRWVQSNISYIAFENGMAGFIPRAASDVCIKRYGDCKDMANLLKSMLNATGIEAYHTWIGTRSKPYSYYDVPSTTASNHMICAAKLNNEYIFLDATDSYLPFGKPSSMIQDKEALIGLDNNNFKIVKVPVVARSENQRIDTLSVNVSDKGLRGSASTWLLGYKKDDLEYKHLKYQIDKDDDFLEDFLSIGGDNISIEDHTIQGLGVQNQPAKIHAKFLLPGYQKSVGDRIYVNLNLNKSLPGELIDATTRSQPLEESYLYENRSLTIFQIPENYSANALPKDSNKSWDDFGVSTHYSIKGDKVFLEKIFFSNYLYLEPAKFSQWNEMLKALTDINQQVVILSKVN